MVEHDLNSITQTIGRRLNRRQLLGGSLGIMALPLLQACGASTSGPTPGASEGVSRTPARESAAATAPTPTSAPKPAATATPVPKPAATATTQPVAESTPTPVREARIEQALLAKDVKEFQPVEPTTVFREGTQKFFVVGRVVDAPNGTKLKVVWKAVEVPGIQGNDRVLEREVSVDGTRPFAFSLETNKPLPPGRYAADIELNGKTALSLAFSVIAPVIPVLARPERDLPAAGSRTGATTGTGTGAASGGEATASKPIYVQFIVDASGSMADPVSGVPKMEVAREALHGLVSALPNENPNLHVGLRAYAHRHPTTDKTKSCEDSELLVPMQGIDKNRLRAAIDSLKPTGWTPMAFSVQQAVKDFPNGDAQKIAVLVSDGEETCDPDPVASIKQAAGQVKLVTHVVGFDIAEEKTRAQLKAIAEATGGVYADARTASELTGALREITTERVKVVRVRSGLGQLTYEAPKEARFYSWTITTQDGKDAVDEYGFTGPKEYQLPAGMHTVRLSPTQLGKGALFRVEIGAGQESILRLGALHILARQTPYSSAIVDQESERRIAEPYGLPSGPVVIPSGRYSIFVKPTQLGDMLLAAKDVEIKANSIVEVEV